MGGICTHESRDRNLAYIVYTAGKPQGEAETQINRTGNHYILRGGRRKRSRKLIRNSLSSGVRVRVGSRHPCSKRSHTPLSFPRGGGDTLEQTR